MTTSVRYSTLTNATGAAVIAGAAAITQGQDYAEQCVDVTLTAADVGTGAGQIRHAAGMIFAEFNGAVVKRVTADIIRPGANSFDYIFLGADDVAANIGFSVTYANGKSTVRIRDGATAGGGQVAANDHIVALIELGNS